MGWSEVSIMSARREFVKLAVQEGANVRELCRRYGISPTTAYKWMGRGEDESETYEDRSRRPQHSPNRTDEAIEQKVLAIRDAHPVWNARKIRRLLKPQLEQGQLLPAASTIGQILKRNVESTNRPVPRRTIGCGSSMKRRTSCRKSTSKGTSQRARESAIR